MSDTSNALRNVDLVNLARDLGEGAAKGASSIIDLASAIFLSSHGGFAPVPMESYTAYGEAYNKKITYGRPIQLGQGNDSFDNQVSKLNGFKHVGAMAGISASYVQDVTSVLMTLPGKKAADRSLYNDLIKVNAAQKKIEKRQITKDEILALFEDGETAAKTYVDKLNALKKAADKIGKEHGINVHLAEVGSAITKAIACAHMASAGMDTSNQASATAQ